MSWPDDVQGQKKSQAIHSDVVLKSDSVLESDSDAKDLDSDSEDSDSSHQDSDLDSDGTLRQYV